VCQDGLNVIKPAHLSYAVADVGNALAYMANLVAS
jgi:hypothetical protein